MNTLDEIAIANGTDKATTFTRTYARPKGYTRHFEKFFEPIREKEIKLLEIGVGGGESIRTWLAYFCNAEIFGVDIVSGTNPYNTPGAGTHDRYQFFQGDQTDKTMLACLVANIGRGLEIVIDDGSHEPGGIITAFQCLWPALSPDGYYAIEDLACGFTTDGYPSHLEWLAILMESVNQGVGDIDSIYFSRELAILQKAYV